MPLPSSHTKTLQNLRESANSAFLTSHREYVIGGFIKFIGHHILLEMCGGKCILTQNSPNQWLLRGNDCLL